MDSEKLLACPNPWCGSMTAAMLFGTGRNEKERQWTVRCGCGVVTFRRDTPEEATALWNTRPTPENGLREALEAEREFAESDPSAAIEIEAVLGLYRFDSPCDRSRAHEALRVMRTRKQECAFDESKARIAIWNTLRQRGMSQEACYPIINDLIAALQHNTGEVG